MAKVPAFQFYPGDWMKDPALSRCTLPTRAVWIDMLCAMHENGRSGQITGTTEQLARICRCTAAELSVAITDLQSTRAADVTFRGESVTIICRRMRREARERDAALQRQRRHRVRHEALRCHALSQNVTPENAPASNCDNGTSAICKELSREHNIASSSSSSSSDKIYIAPAVSDPRSHPPAPPPVDVSGFNEPEKADVDWSAPEKKAERYVLIVCGLWDVEAMEPMPMPPRKYQDMCQAAAWLRAGDRLRKAGHPDVFVRWWRNETNRRGEVWPLNITEHWQAFQAWKNGEQEVVAA